MTFALFMLGLLVIFVMARYNNSNKLFWTLGIAFTLGYACTKMVYDSLSTDEQSEKSLNQAYPTQGLASVGETFVCFFNNTDIPTIVKVTSKPVSQANTPGYIEPLITLCNVSGATRGLTLHALPNPPNSVEIVDTS